MERYWCLRWLAQEGRTIVEARATGRDDHAVLVDIPLAVRVPGLGAAATVVRGQRIEVEVVATDLVDLSIECRLVAIIEEVDEDELVDVEAGDPVEAVDAAAVVGAVDDTDGPTSPAAEPSVGVEASATGR